MRLVDAHIHLPAYSDPTDVIELARSSGTTLISCTVNASEVERNLLLRARWPGTVSCFVGVHPSDVSSENPSERLKDIVEGCDGIGEIGLDPKYSEVSRGSMQMSAFEDQLELAERTGKPVEVHSRGAEKVCLETLGSFRLKSVLMHWFEGEQELQLLESSGSFVSFGPALLYSKRLRRIAAKVPADRILTETDGPVAYGPIEGRSGPVLIASVLFTLAEVEGVSFEEAARRVEENARGFLHPDE